jgi:succinyl-diaminopimelate desuccinylase
VSGLVSGPSAPATAEDLLALTASLVAVPSPSHAEGPLADLVEAALRASPWLATDRVGDNVVARTQLGRARRVVVAGHLDTVPATAENGQPRREGDNLSGVGAADMKGGLAVLLNLARTVEAPVVDVTWCFYACEEVEQLYNGVRHLFEVRPDLLAADAAVLAEPTAGVVEAGCQGTLRIRISVRGRRAHTARPAEGRNAIHRLAPLLAAVDAYEGRRPVIDGCQYAEQLQVVRVEGGVASNVVPDEATVVVNHRFAPDRSAGEAEAGLRALLGPYLEQGDSWDLVDAAAGAPPALTEPFLAALVGATGAPARAKLGWTDAATFAAHGIPATNFGPGDPRLAHTPDEFVTGGELVEAATVLASVLGGPAPTDRPPAD